MKHFPRWLLAIVIVVLALPLAAFGYLNLQADKMIWYKFGKDYWLNEQPAVCNDYRRLYYRDLRPNAPAGATTEISCEQALKLPAESRFAQTEDGLNIHYRVFNTPLQNAPVLLHVSGITSTWLNGARYAKAAERMGFQLMTIEMRNHGTSGHDAKGVGYGCREKADVLAVLNALKPDLKGRQVMIWAASGATLTLVNAAAQIQTQHPEVKALVLESPISALRDVAKAKSPGLPDPLYNMAIGVANWRTGLDFNTCSAKALAGSVRLPTLLTSVTTDTLTPTWMAEEILAALPAQTGKLVKYPEGAHEAIWNGQPAVYEAELKQHWQHAHSVH